MYMRQIDIFVQSLKKNETGSLTNNTIKLKYTLPENCCVKDLLNTINDFKSPKNQIKALFNSNGHFIPNDPLKHESIYFYLS